MTDYELFVDDNYHYMDEESRYSAGTFTSYDEALKKAKKIVGEFLEAAHQPGMTSKELYEGYMGFGEDPFIIPAADPHFSAWDYARARCIDLCRDEDAVASVLRYQVWPPELGGFHTVLLAALRRENLGAAERKAVETFCRSIEDYPNAMPCDNRWYWLRLECGKTSYTVYLYPDRFKLLAVNNLQTSVEWVLRFFGTGRCDRRAGDVGAAFKAMRQAALDPEFILKVKA